MAICCHNSPRDVNPGANATRLYDVAPVRGSESDASILNEIDRNTPCRQAQVFIERCQGWYLLAGTA
jgi:hypothetical protein